MPEYILALGPSPTQRDIDVALAVGQRWFLASAGTLAARYLLALPDDLDVHVVLDSYAWPIDNLRRPRFDGWWQHVRGWRRGPGDYGRLGYAIGYDVIGDPVATNGYYRQTLSLMARRELPDLPMVPVLTYGDNPAGLSVDMLYGYAGVRDDLVSESGERERPFYAVGGLVPQRGNKASVAWVQSIADELAGLCTDSGEDEALCDPQFLGVHLLGSTRPDYWRALESVGLRVWCDNSTPLRQAGFGDEQLAWAYTDAYGLDQDLLHRSRFARVAWWLCRERALCSLPWTMPDPTWLEELPGLQPWVKPAQQAALDLFAA
jgi:hypothetical protein